ncbi:MAG: hypothetical protein AAF922_00215 [Pseudomonadota bacterium]
MRKYLLGLFLCFSVTLAHAQTSSIRSGEHENYTRLVFPLTKRIKFKIAAVENRIVLRFEEKSIKFDTKGIFTRIPRTRLDFVEYDQVQSEVSLYLNCNCDFRAFWFQETNLVLDILDSVNAASEGTKLRVHELVSKTGLNRMSNVKNELAEAYLTSLTATELRKALKKIHWKKIKAKNSLNKIKTDTRMSISDLERDTNRPATGEIAQDRNERPRQSDFSQTYSSQIQNTELTEILESHSISLHEQIEIKAGNENNQEITTEEIGTEDTEKCIQNRILDIPSWRNDEIFQEGIGESHARIFNERDSLNEDNVLLLAKHYIYYGFGIEALAVLQLLENTSHEIEVLKALAEVVDGGTTSSSELKGQFLCQGYSQFWAIFSGEEVSAVSELNDRALIATFIRLPRHLRRYLGPIASGILLSAGEDELSSAILRTVEVVENETSPSISFAIAELNRHYGQNETAKDKYQRVIDDKASQELDALVRQVQLLISEGVLLDDLYSELSQMAVHKEVEEMSGKELETLQILSLGKLGRFKTAYEKLDQSKFLDTGDRDRTRSIIASILLKSADDLEILKNYFSGRIGDTQTISDEVAIKLSEILHSSGFVSDAKRVLDRSFHSSVSKTSRLERARVGIALKMINYSKKQLLGIEGRRVDHLIKSIQFLESQRDATSIVNENLDQFTVPEKQQSLNSNTNLRNDDSTESLIENKYNEKTLEFSESLLRLNSQAKKRFQTLLNANPIP